LNFIDTRRKAKARRRNIVHSSNFYLSVQHVKTHQDSQTKAFQQALLCVYTITRPDFHGSICEIRRRIIAAAAVRLRNCHCGIKFFAAPGDEAKGLLIDVTAGIMF